MGKCDTNRPVAARPTGAEPSLAARARMIRRVSLACKRAAAAGSTVFNWLCSQPASSASDFRSKARRNSQSAGGPLKIPRKSPLR